jgi:hypothetical protein
MIYVDESSTVATLPSERSLQTGKPNHIFFALDNDSYIAGDKADGVVVVVVQEEVTPTRLVVRWVQEEFTSGSCVYL